MKYLITIFLNLLISVNLLAETNYIFAANDGVVDMVGSSGGYDVNKDVLTIGSDILGGIHWENRKFYYTTNTLPNPFTNISQVTVVKLWPLTEQEKQDTKPLVVKQAENKFILICEALTGVRTKAPMETLTALVEQMQETDPMGAITISLKLLALDSQLKRESGNLWWDTCVWHSEIIEP